MVGFYDISHNIYLRVTLRKYEHIEILLCMTVNYVKYVEHDYDELRNHISQL
jgi:hypothetical protein